MTDIRVTIDGQELLVPSGTLVIRAAEELGITIPRFCDHPLLDPLGACRQCMVEVEGQAKPFTACTTTCTDGMVVRTHLQSDVARVAQEAQLEFLLINHPLDCPQCDKGGECPLQDQTLAHGPPDTSMVDRKRRYQKPVPISPQVLLDRERCVLCARCTRFSQEISGDPFIELFERGALEQVSIYEDEPYNSYFSGNVVQICPVGALTSTDYRFRARPFDLLSRSGVCNQCSVGCNLRVDVRRGKITRQLARENPAVNEMWNCDKGRFAFQFVHHPDRLGEPLVRDRSGNLMPVPWRAALERAAEKLREAAPERVGVIAGARLTDEDLYAASRFARDVLRTDNIDFRMAPRDDERPVFGALAGTLGPTYDDVERADVVVVVGLDPREEVPVLFLRLRKAWRKRKQKIVVVGPTAGSLRDIAWRWVQTPAGGEARVLADLAAPQAPAGGGRDVEDVAEALAGASTAVVLAGERLAQSPGALPAAAALARTGGHLFAWVPRRTNARGAVDAGLAPGLLPGGRSLDDPGPIADAWYGLPDQVGLDARGMLEAAAAGDLQVLYLIGVDPARDFEDPRLAEEGLRRVPTLIVHELLPTASTRYADVLLPAAAPQERVGSFTTWEGRRQPFEQAVPRHGLSQRDWDILRQLATALGADLGWEVASDVRREAAPLMEISTAALDRLGDIPASAVTDEHAPDGYPLRAVVIDELLGEGTLLGGTKFLRETAPPPQVTVNETDARRLGISDGQHVAVVGPGGRWELPAAVGDGVVPGCVVLPRNSTPVTPGSLLAADAPAGSPVWVRLEPQTSATGSSGARSSGARSSGARSSGARSSGEGASR